MKPLNAFAHDRPPAKRSRGLTLQHLTTPSYRKIGKKTCVASLGLGNRQCKSGRRQLPAPPLGPGRSRSSCLGAVGPTCFCVVLLCRSCAVCRVYVAHSHPATLGSECRSRPRSEAAVEKRMATKTEGNLRGVVHLLKEFHTDSSTKKALFLGL